MKKKEILKNLEINKIDNTVFINNKHFQFSFTKADDVVKDEFKGQYRYFGGLQCNYDENSQEYKNLENYLCGISEFLLSYIDGN